MSNFNHKSLCLKDYWYPAGSAQPTNIRSSQTRAYNYFEIKPQTFNMLPQFTRNEDAYVLMREFEDEERLNLLEKSLEVLIKSHNDFMQITG